ncbi:phage holin family protein [Methylobacterium segetis]|uniref:phage holin family protein n=1 Tax=Methylobacterium segetis TaxID=2488750 RepID=UPI00104DB32B|nr:phage holin family protein [Methylobacterium segetis]
MATAQTRSIPSLIGAAIRETQDLVGKEIALFRREMGEGLERFALGISLFVAAAVFALTAVLVFILAAVKALAVLLNSEALAALIVGGLFAAVALALALWGRSKASASSLEPARTERQVQEDARIITERMDA